MSLAVGARVLLTGGAAGFSSHPSRIKQISKVNSDSLSKQLELRHFTNITEHFVGNVVTQRTVSFELGFIEKLVGKRLMGERWIAGAILASIFIFVSGDGRLDKKQIANFIFSLLVL